jgi:thioesterase domain-containing protein
VSSARLTDLESLRVYLAARIPPARALGIGVEAVDPVTIAAPLEANLNDKGTGFAGSLYSVAALAGWALLMRWCAAESLDAEVVLQGSTARFLAPARTDFRAIAHELPGAERDRLRRMMARSGRGRGRAEVAVDVRCQEALVMSFSGTYAVIAGGRAK